MTQAVTAWWADEPLHRFVDDSSVKLAILMRPSGQVVAQHGFGRAADVMAASALAAAIQSSADEIGRLLNGQPFVNIYQAGERTRLFLGRCDTSRGPFVLLAIFGAASSLGLVQLHFEEFRRAIVEGVTQTPPASPLFEGDFEGALARSLDALFAQPGRGQLGRS